MPERPDLEWFVPLLREAVVGAKIAGFRVVKPPVLRVAVPGDAAALLVGHTIAAVERRGPFIRFVLDPPGPASGGGAEALEVAVHPMLAGRFTVAAPGARGNADLAAVFDLDDGRELRYRDDRQMGKVYVLRRGEHAGIPGLEKVGLDVLDPDVFTADAFRRLASKRRDQVKSFLLDHAALDTLGNAYSDETCWEARIHPKTRVKELKPDQIDALHAAIVGVITRARDEIFARQPAMDEKLRDFLAVRNRKDEPCPRCGTKIRVCGIHGHDAFFCPQCQPDEKGRGFVDWRRVKG